MVKYSFEWLPYIHEVEYLFHIIDIVHQYDGTLSILKQYTNENKIKFEVQFKDIDRLNSFKNHISDRLSFENWLDTLEQDNGNARWIFLPNKHNSQTVKEVREFISQAVKGYNVFVPVGMKNLVIIPSSEYQPIPDNDVFDSYVAGIKPTYAQMKRGISELISIGDKVSYFRSPRRWDAQIKTKQGSLLVMTFSDTSDENNLCELNLDGDIKLAKALTQYIANLCGTMFLIGNHIQTMVFEPEDSST